MGQSLSTHAMPWPRSLAVWLSRVFTGCMHHLPTRPMLIDWVCCTLLGKFFWVYRIRSVQSLMNIAPTTTLSLILFRTAPFSKGLAWQPTRSPNLGSTLPPSNGLRFDKHSSSEEIGMSRFPVRESIPISRRISRSFLAFRLLSITSRWSHVHSA